jgi:hypothetical protein
LFSQSMISDTIYYTFSYLCPDGIHIMSALIYTGSMRNFAR